jgi:hypothetical protein
MKLVGLHSLVTRAEMAYRLLILKIFKDSVLHGRDTNKFMALLYGGTKSGGLHTFYYNLLTKMASPSTAADAVKKGTTTTDQTSCEAKASSSSTVPPSTSSSTEEGTSNQQSKKEEKKVKAETDSENILNKQIYLYV